MPNFLGRLQTFLFGAAVGRAASDAITPILEPVKQQAWNDNPNRVLEPGTAAHAVAQGIIEEGEGQWDARRGGVGINRFGVLWRLAQTVPGIGEARALRRRQKGHERQITLEQLHHVYAKNQIEPQYWDGLDALVRDILSPGEIAAGIHRNLIPDLDPPLLKGEQPSGDRNVTPYPVYPIDAEAEAMGHGIDRDRLGVLVGLQGLPMGVIEAAHAYWRGIITHGDYIAAFNQSNNRNEWAEAVLQYSRQIPTARDFMENALRGHHDFDWAAQQAERHGMTREDAFLIYQNQGRPLNLHQITQGLAWGGTYQPGQGDNADPWMQAVLLGAVRPEYYDLQRHLKYNLPSALYFRTLQQTGVLKEDEAATWYRRLGWPPELADQVAKAYAGGSGSGASGPWAKKAETQLWTATHKGFINGEVSEPQADAALTSIGVPQAERSAVLTFWNEEKAITVKPLTPSQIKRAYKANDLTIDDAVARLELQHYTDADARTYLTT